MNHSYKMMNDRKTIDYGLGLTTVKRGRLAGYHAPPQAADKAELLTRPFVLDKPQLRVNANATQGEIKVALTSESGTTIPGCSYEDALPVQQDGLNIPLYWKNTRDLGDLVGKPIRARVRVRNAAIYGLSTQEFPS